MFYSASTSFSSLQMIQENILSIPCDDIRILGRTFLSCTPVKTFLTPFLSAIKQFLPLNSRGLSQRDWTRILVIKPYLLARTTQEMLGSLLKKSREQKERSVKNLSPSSLGGISKEERKAEKEKLSRMLRLLSDCMNLYGTNKHRWSSVLSARQSYRAIEGIVSFCNSFIHIAEIIAEEDYPDEEHPELSKEENLIDCLYTLRREHEHLEYKLYEHFKDPLHIYACNYSMKNILEYPGSNFHNSQSVNVCTALHLFPSTPLLVDLGPVNRSNEHNSVYGSKIGGDAYSQPFLPTSTVHPHSIIAPSHGASVRGRVELSKIILKGTVTSSSGTGFRDQVSGSSSGVRDRGNVSGVRDKVSGSDVRDSGSVHGEYWWWDAVSSCDWPLLIQLLPQASRIESSGGLECLLLECVKRGAGAGVVREFVR